MITIACGACSNATRAHAATCWHSCGLWYVELDKDALDAIIAGLIDPDPQTRITLSDALTKLNEVMVTMPK